MILENKEVRYDVVLNGAVIKKSCRNRSIAENFVDSLDEESRLEAQIIPVSEKGQQILLG